MPPSLELIADSSGKTLDKDEVKESLDKLRSLILADIRYNMRKDDIYLLRYLHCTGFKIEDAFKRILSMNELRIDNPEWFARSPPTDYDELLSWNSKAVLDCRDKFGRRIYFTRIGNIDASKTSIQELASFDDLWMEAIFDEPETQATGICAVVDLTGFSWKMFRWLTPRNVRVSTKMTEIFPVKKLVIHVINSSMLLNAAVALLFPFLSAHTKEHIHFHYENWSSLHEHVDPKYLPKEYGGQLDSFDFSNRNQWLIEQTSRLMENFKNDNRL